MPFYMQVPDIKGNVTLKGHEDWILVEGVDWGIRRSIHLDVGKSNNRENSRPSFSEVLLRKKIDQASPKLFSLTGGGRSIEKVVIDHCRTDDPETPILRYTLHNVLVSHYAHTTQSESHGENVKDSLMETLRLNYTKLELSYIPRDSTLTSTSPITAGYDLTTAQLT